MLNISSSSNHLLHVTSSLFGEMWHFVTVGRTSTERDGNLLQQLRGGGSWRKRVAVSLEILGIVVWSWGNPADRFLWLYRTLEEALDANTPWKETNCRCIRPPPPSISIHHLQGRSSHVLFIKDRQQIPSGVCETHKEAEAQTFTTHLPFINPNGGQIAIGLPLLASVHPSALYPASGELRAVWRSCLNHK